MAVDARAAALLGGRLRNLIPELRFRTTPTRSSGLEQNSCFRSAMAAALTVFLGAHLTREQQDQGPRADGRTHARYCAGFMAISFWSATP